FAARRPGEGGLPLRRARRRLAATDPALRALRPRQAISRRLQLHVRARREHPCPMCPCFLDGLDRYALHLAQRVNLAVVAKSPIERIHAWAAERGWTRLRLLSSSGNTYNADYFAEDPEGGQMPACNVFTRTDDGIFHFSAAEVLYAPVKGHPRHV